MRGQTKKLSKKQRGKPPVTKYMQEFAEGEKVTIDIESAENDSAPHPRHQGAVARVFGEQGRCYRLKLKDGRELVVHPVHLRSIK